MEIHHCIHCGTEAQSTWRFCRRCGTGLADLEQTPRVAECSNCATELADGWRFCPNCGTSSDTATPREGLSADDVAELIATPDTDTAALDTLEADRADTRVEDEVATIPDGPPTETGGAVEEPQPDPTPLEPAPSSEPFDDEPVISSPQISFEPAEPDFREPAVPDIASDAPGPPTSGFDLQTTAPPPPLDPMLTVAEIEARLAADQPPPPGDSFGDGLEPEIVDDGPLPQDWDSAGEPAAAEEPSRGAFEVHRESPEDVSAAPRDVTKVPGIDEPSVVIPPARTGERPPVRTEVPTPLGSPRQPATEIPQPLGTEKKSTWSPTPARATERPAGGELAPTDRLFEDPGLLGQSTQLALLATAAISVAMVVAHIVLNNRLTDYAETGESIPRVESVQSIIGSWLRPMLIVALVGVYLLTVVWSRRVVANLAIFGKSVPETAPWMWAIPLVNILVVRQHFDTAWKGSDVLLKDDPDWQKAPGNWWTLGFAALAIATVGVLMVGSIVDSQTVEGSIDSNAYLMIGYALLAASLLCLVRSISGIVERQYNRARHFV